MEHYTEEVLKLFGEKVDELIGDLKNIQTVADAADVIDDIKQYKRIFWNEHIADVDPLLRRLNEASYQTEIHFGLIEDPEDKYNKEFYFTFGSAEHFPFNQNEYVMITAPSYHSAATLFNILYPFEIDGEIDKETLNCAFTYTEKEWVSNDMAERWYNGKEPAKTFDVETFLKEISEEMTEDLQNLKDYRSILSFPSLKLKRIKEELIGSLLEEPFINDASKDYIEKINNTLAIQEEMEHILDDNEPER